MTQGHITAPKCQKTWRDLRIQWGLCQPMQGTNIKDGVLHEIMFLIDLFNLISLMAVWSSRIQHTQILLLRTSKSFSFVICVFLYVTLSSSLHLMLPSTPSDVHHYCIGNLQEWGLWTPGFLNSSVVTSCMPPAVAQHLISVLLRPSAQLTD